MNAKTAGRRAVQIQIGSRKQSQLLEDHILNHATVPFREQERVWRGIIFSPLHQFKVDTVNDLSAGICGPNVQGLHLLRDLQYPLPELDTPEFGGSDID
jgi:hypothetical protein